MLPFYLFCTNQNFVFIIRFLIPFVNFRISVYFVLYCIEASPKSFFGPFLVVPCPLRGSKFWVCRTGSSFCQFFFIQSILYHSEYFRICYFPFLIIANFLLASSTTLSTSLSLKQLHKVKLVFQLRKGNFEKGILVVKMKLTLL